MVIDRRSGVERLVKAQNAWCMSGNSFPKKASLSKHVFSGQTSVNIYPIMNYSSTVLSCLDTWTKPLIGSVQKVERNDDMTIKVLIWN